MITLEFTAKLDARRSSHPTRAVSKATNRSVFAHSLAAHQLPQRPPIITTVAITAEEFLFFSLRRRTQFALSERVSRSERGAIPKRAHCCCVVADDIRG